MPRVNLRHVAAVVQIGAASVVASVSIAIFKNVKIAYNAVRPSDAAPVEKDVFSLIRRQPYVDLAAGPSFLRLGRHAFTTPVWRAAVAILKGRFMSIRFVYFDLGNVLLFFSVHRLCCQLAEAAQTTEAEIRGGLFDEQKYRQYERGEISTEDYYEQACSCFEHKPTLDEFTHAISDIFWANDLILPVVRKLVKFNVPRGILSNTNPAHWSYVENAFPRIWDAFEDHRIASFNARALKPFREIYETAFLDAKRSVPDLQPDEVLFIDDLEDNVKGAAEFGFQTIHYVDFDQFLEEYKKTGLPVPTRYLVWPRPEEREPETPPALDQTSYETSEEEEDDSDE